MSRRRIIGILREVKNKWEQRVSLVPSDVRKLVDQGIQVLVQPSTLRVYADSEFEAAGAVVTEDLSDASCIFGVKEFPKEHLLPDRSYVLFSHTIKAQPYNMGFLDECLERNVRLLDYECIRDDSGRLVAFGEFAGLAGMVDTFHGLGKRLLAQGYCSPFLGVSMSYSYPSVQCAMDAVSMLGKRIGSYGLPADLAPFRVVFTGSGNVTNGALRMFEGIPHQCVPLAELKDVPADPHTVFCAQVTAEDLVERTDGGDFDKSEYYSSPELYSRVFGDYIGDYDLLVNGAYWDQRFPRVLSDQDLLNWQGNARQGKFKSELRMVSDIACDVEGGVQFLKKATTLDSPFFVYDAESGVLVDGFEGEGCLVMGVDNLPAEFPREASEHFSSRLAPLVDDFLKLSNQDADFTSLEQEVRPEVHGACITSDGTLTPFFDYISSLRLVNEKEHADTTGSCHRLILIQGHLFDSGFINQAFDALEAGGQDFSVVEWFVTPNRSERKTNISRCVMKVSGNSEAHVSDGISKLGLLASVVPKAQATVVELPDSDEAITLAPPQLDDFHQGNSTGTGTRSFTTATSLVAPARAAGSGLRDSGMLRAAGALRRQRGIRAFSTSSGSLVGQSVGVLGSGSVAGPCAQYLQARGARVTVAAIDEEASHGLLGLSEAGEQVGYSPEYVAQHAVEEVGLVPGADTVTPLAAYWDASNTEALGALVEECQFDAVISLLPPPFHPAVAELCLFYNTPFVSASYTSDDMRALDDRAREKGVVLLNEIGLDPGIDHMLTAEDCAHINAQDGKWTIDRFESMCGGLPCVADNDNAIGYKFSWSPRGALTALGSEVTYKRDGKTVTHSADKSLHDLRELEVGGIPLVCYPNRDSLSYEDVYGLHDLQTCFRGTLRYAGFCEVFRTLRSLNMLSTSESADSFVGAHVTADWIRQQLGGVSDADAGLTADFVQWVLDGDEILQGDTPVDALCERLISKCAYQPEEHDLVAMYGVLSAVEESTGERVTVSSELVAEGGRGVRPSTMPAGAGSGLLGWSAMARTVGLPVAMGAECVLDGGLPSGLVMPTYPDIYPRMLEQLAKEGISANRTHSSA